MNILIVDDDSTDVRFLQELLTEADAGSSRLVHVENLTTALQRLQEELFDIVLLDFFLPGSQGLESLHRLREQTPEVPIVFMTGLNDEGLGHKMIKSGAQGYLVKGQIEGSALLRTLHDIIAQHRAQHA
jgi:two-component system cell cycle response regulator